MGPPALAAFKKFQKDCRAIGREADGLEFVAGELNNRLTELGMSSK